MMDITQVIDNLIKKEGKTLIFVLGEDARTKIETGLVSKNGTIDEIEKSRRDIQILFLNRLHYLFMFLMKLEAEKTNLYNNIVIYGLDSLILPHSSIERIRLCNLILSTLYKVKRQQELDEVLMIRYGNLEKTDDEQTNDDELNRLDKYWQYILS